MTSVVVECDAEPSSSSRSIVGIFSQTTQIRIQTPNVFEGDFEDSTPRGEDVGTTASLPLAVSRAYSTLVEILSLSARASNAFDGMPFRPPKGVLIYGPPGVGKTTLVRQAAKECDAMMIAVNGSDLFGSFIGDSESNLRRVFEDAERMGRTEPNRPCLIFIDELVGFLVSYKLGLYIDFVCLNRTHCVRRAERQRRTRAAL